MNLVVKSVVVFFALFLGASVVSATNSTIAHQQADILDQLETIGIFEDVFNGARYLEYSDDWNSGFSLMDFETVVNESFMEGPILSGGIEKGATANYDLYYEKEKGRLVVRENRFLYSDFMEPDYYQITESDIEELACHYLGLIGIGRIDDTEMDVRRLQRSSRIDTVMDQQYSEVSEYPSIETDDIAFRVRIHRTINGERLEGQRATIGFFNDGSLQKVSLRWPTIAAKSYQLYFAETKTEISERVYNSLKNHPLGEIQELVYRTGLMLLNGEVRRVITVTGSLRGPGGIDSRKGELIIEI